ncbi:hypothetical protein BC834DRAFT_970153 [Gloeopeniophorella convolvens]|nr:hypothetical protein BC834DRAFT_970153 [Gloeopeniophorella convolvens]
MASSFSVLPTEVLVLVFAHLPIHDVFSCMVTCHWLSEVIHNSAALQYRILAKRYGVRDPLASELSNAERVALLKCWEKAWLGLDLGGRTASIPAHGPHVQYVTQQGFLIAARRGYSSHSPFFGYSYVSLSAFAPAGQEVRDAPWTNVNVEESATQRKLVFDIEQGLTAVAVSRRDTSLWTLELRFVDFFTGNQHPLATQPAIKVDLDWNITGCPLALTVMGDYVALLITSAHGNRRGDSLRLINWKTGKTHLLRQVTRPTYRPVLTFIAKDTLVLGWDRKASLEICKLDQDGDALRLRTLCFLRMPSCYRGAQLILELHPRPPLDLGTSDRCDTSRLPFSSDPSETVLSFQLTALQLQEARRFKFWIHPRSLLALASAAARECEPAPLQGSSPKTQGAVSWIRRRFSLTLRSKQPVKNRAPTRKWEEWGPWTTRWLEVSPYGTSVTTSGTRSALVTAPEETAFGTLELFDFHQDRVFRVLVDEDVDSPRKSWAITSPSTILKGRSFRQDVVSELPYCKSVLTNVGSRVLLDDEWLIYSWNDDSETAHLDLYPLTYRQPASPHST